MARFAPWSSPANCRAVSHWLTSLPERNLRDDGRSSVSLSKPLTFAHWRNLTLFWFAHSVVYAQQTLTLAGPGARPPAFAPALMQSLGTWMPWVPLSAFVVWLVARFPLEREHALRSVGAMTVGALVVITAKAVFVLAFNEIFHWYATTPAVTRVFRASLLNNLFLYCLVVAGAHALLYAARYRQRDAELAAARASLSEARLQALSAQLNPHFLFNTLNAIAELVHHDADAADRMLVGLAALMRRSLATTGEQEVPLRDEIAMLDEYFAIQRVRFGARLRTSFAVDADCLDAKVPFLVLQPLVENAIVHGIARRTDGGEVLISARRRHDTLELVVENSAAPGAEVSRGTGIGLANSVERLRCLYGDAGTLALANGADGVTRVTVELPFVAGTQRGTTS